MTSSARPLGFNTASKGHLSCPSNLKSIPYEEAVRQALCFGWVDSLIKRLDDARYAIKVTPRQPTSTWSAANRRRWAELKAAGLLAPAGLAAPPTKNTYAPKPTIPELPNYIARAIKPNPKAWQFFKALRPRERRNFVVWIHIAKRPDTRNGAFAKRLISSRLAKNSV